MSDCDIPDFNIGAGETLRSIQWVALYDDWNDGVHRILKVIQPESEGEPENQRRNAYDEENITTLIPWSITSLLNDRKHERTSEKFLLVQDDHRIREYSRQEVDKLTPTQRERLFTADSEMAAWWRGKSITNGAWSLFRLRGGTWISKSQIDQALGQISEEQKYALWKIPGLNEWFVDGLVF